MFWYKQLCECPVPGITQTHRQYFGLIESRDQ